MNSLRSGESDSVFLYETQRTDKLLRQLAGRAEVQSLHVELTDVSDDGMRHVASLPNLRKLLVYGGSPGVGNAGIEHLAACKSLEILELINTHVTNEGLRFLRDLPKLRCLKLFYEAWRGACLTDAAVAHLRHLENLERLELAGGWASEAAISDLKQALPTCEITVATF